jgi:uncharacterized protein (TIRG00374 family)
MRTQAKTAPNLRNSLNLFLKMKQFKKIAPFVISMVLLAILIGYAPWGEVGKILSDFDWTTIIILIVLSLAYYGLKAFRFWWLLIAMGIRKPFRLVALSYISAQPASLLPGGEVFRSHALEQHTGVPVKKSIPQFTMQGILEGAGLATVMLASALALHALRIPALILTFAVIIGLAGLTSGYLVPFLRLLNHLPYVDISEKSIYRFSESHKEVLNGKWLPPMYALSLLTEVIGAAIAYTSIHGLGGHINVWQAGLMYVIPVIVGFVSLLPGGFGLSEQSAIGVLLLSDVTTALAVAGTLIMRVTIVGLGVLYGVIALSIGQMRLRQRGKTVFEI